MVRKVLLDRYVSNRHDPDVGDAVYLNLDCIGSLVQSYFSDLKKLLNQIVVACITKCLPL